MEDKVLLVDDEMAILEGYQRLLRNEFHTDIAAGGAAALTAISSKGPYAVVVSDMRMPGMDGVQFLNKVKATQPEIVRIMLTGNADLQTAVSAVNEGNIFRFLTKPCTKETLAKTLTAGLMQYRLVVAEKELLEKTLSGSVSVLTEVLSLVNPIAFSRSARIRRYIHHIAAKLALPSPWRFEVAGMMSQLGCVTLLPETLEDLYAGKTLSPEEQARVDAHPAVAADLLSKIPRMEPIAWMIAHQNELPTVDGDISDRDMADMRLGAAILRVTVAFDELLRREDMSRTEAAHRLARQFRDVDRRVFEALVEVEPEADARQTRACGIEELAAGMILEQDVRTVTGMLIVSRGQEVTLPLIVKLKNFLKKAQIESSVTVSSSPSRAAASAGS
jgi:response regulator RpfG family c-di-GMP phosphodiesterase